MKTGHFILGSSLLLVGLMVMGFIFKPSNNNKRALIFSKTNGYRHESIADGIAAIKALGKANHFDVDATEDSLQFNPTTLRQYQAIVLLSTTGKVFGEAEKKALQQFVQQGGGIVGIHAATDCEYDWPWYVEMIGGNFESHPEQQVAQLQVVDSMHISTNHLPKIWQRKDEWYNFKNLNSNVHQLLRIDESSYQGGKNGTIHPMAWYHNFDGGRVFYTALGHTRESFQEPLFLQHVLGGIRYAMNEK